MSAIGTKRTCASALHMSAFGGKADIDASLQFIRLLGGAAVVCVSVAGTMRRSTGFHHQFTAGKPALLSICCVG